MGNRVAKALREMLALFVDPSQITDLPAYTPIAPTFSGPTLAHLRKWHDALQGVGDNEHQACASCVAWQQAARQAERDRDVARLQRDAHAVELTRVWNDNQADLKRYIVDLERRLAETRRHAALVGAEPGSMIADTLEAISELEQRVLSTHRRVDMVVRCKFKLDSVTERFGYTGQGGDSRVYDAVFSAVYSQDPNSENKKFWDATPSGEFKVSTIKQMPWELGREYYLDITPA